MRRNFKSVIKFAFLCIFTVLCTVLVFRTLRPAHKGYNSLSILPLGLQQQDHASSSKIDWHDHESIRLELQRTGVGEQGAPVKYDPVDLPNYKELYSTNGFNAALSDLISVERSIPDIRHQECVHKKYLQDLPKVSVIVPFHNEHWSTLLRTVHSVINRSPTKLLKEIILVDDASTKAFSRQQLDNYLAKNISNGLASCLHLKERSGLIRARLEGARAASGDVLIFLDSHTEANINWLPPLLEPIVEDYRTCVCPFIDVIQYETFEYRAQDEGARGAFDWEFYYKRLPLLPEDLKHPSKPFKSPVMAGGLFAISTRFFWELGGYDEGLDIWGGEQYELSFKIWQCGGRMLDAPCSRVGHIYRKFAPFPNPQKGDFVGRNYKRVAEVWMDEYAEYLYKRRPHYRSIDAGDLSKQKALRHRLQCKPFKWFMEKVAFDLPLRYPPVEPNDFGYGQIRSVANQIFCLDSLGRGRDQPIELRRCSALATTNDANKVQRTVNPSQHFALTWHKDLRVNGKSICLDVSNPNDKAAVNLYPCHGSKGNQLWKYDLTSQQFIHGTNNRCLDCEISTKKVFVRDCDVFSETQKWTFQYVDKPLLDQWDTTGVQ